MIEISGFVKNTLRFVEPTELFQSAEFLAGADKLWKQGVIFFEGVSNIKKGEKLIAAIYNGETIAQGTKFEIANRFKDIWKLSGDDLLKALGNLTIYDIRYPATGLKSLVKASEAFKQFGRAGQKLVMAVDDEAENILKNFSKSEVHEKVMVSGMVYRKGNNTEIFTATNFLDEEIGKGKGKTFLDFIEDMHPTLKKRFDVHVTRYKAKNLLAEPADIARAGWAGSHGEIRALDALLKKTDAGGKLGDAIFDDIIGYNRFLRKEANKIQPTCVNCFYITKGVKYVGF